MSSQNNDYLGSGVRLNVGGRDEYHVVRFFERNLIRTTLKYVEVVPTGELCGQASPPAHHTLG
jgi:hypothetical protein